MASAVASLMLAACLALAAPAAADIHVDPGGPAGKQYSSPDQRARQEASGTEGSAGVPGSGEQAPLFGQGSGDGRGGGGGGASGEPAGSTSGSDSSDGSEGSSGGGGDAAAIGGAVVAVLAAGGLLAVFMRRRENLAG